MLSSLSSTSLAFLVAASLATNALGRGHQGHNAALHARAASKISAENNNATASTAAAAGERVAASVTSKIASVASVYYTIPDSSTPAFTLTPPTFPPRSPSSTSRRAATTTTSDTGDDYSTSTTASPTTTSSTTKTARPFGNPTPIINPTTTYVLPSSAAPVASSGSGGPPGGAANGAVGGNTAENVGNVGILNYTIPVNFPSNTTIIPANIKENNITGFNAQTLGNNTEAIASWFRTDNINDFTNGHSWCYNPYNDSMPGFAPSFRTMTTNYGGDAIKAGQAYCGLEAIFYLPNGKNVTLYVIDAFDDAWVKTPNSVDVVIGVFPELLGHVPTSKNDVLYPVTWAFTGNRSTEFIFNGGRQV